MSSRIWLPYVRAKSGADVFVTRLAQALSRSGHEPLVQPFEHWYQYAPRLMKTRRPANVDVILANSWNGYAFRQQGVPLIVYVLHCVGHQGYPEWKSRAQAFFHDNLVYRFECASFKSANALVAISNSTRNEMRDVFGIDSARVIPLWVDNSTFAPGNATKTAHEWRTRILIVGNMSRRKGGDLLATFCEALGNQFKVTVVAGLRGKAPAISTHGAELNFVSGLSESELVEAYRTTDVVVSLSRHEGFGYTALEGMACSKPVLAFDVSGLRDVVKNGETGWLSPPQDVAHIVENCRILRRDDELARKMGDAGRKRAVEVFNECKAVNSYTELFNSLRQTS